MKVYLDATVEADLVALGYTSDEGRDTQNRIRRTPRRARDHLDRRGCIAGGERLPRVCPSLVGCGCLPKMARPPEYYLGLLIGELVERLAAAQAEADELREALAEARAAIDSAPALTPADLRRCGVHRMIADWPILAVLVGAVGGFVCALSEWKGGYSMSSPDTLGELAGRTRGARDSLDHERPSHQTKQWRSDRDSRRVSWSLSR